MVSHWADLPSHELPKNRPRAPKNRPGALKSAQEPPRSGLDPSRRSAEEPLARLGSVWKRKASQHKPVLARNGKRVYFSRVFQCLLNSLQALCCFALCFRFDLNTSLCLAGAWLASPALCSRRSLRSLVRCARPRNMKNRGDM